MLISFHEGYSGLTADRYVVEDSGGNQRLTITCIGPRCNAAAAFVRRVRQRGRLYQLRGKIVVRRDEPGDVPAAFTIADLRSRLLVDFPRSEWEPIQPDRTYTALEIARATGVPLGRVEAAVKGTALIPVGKQRPRRYDGELVKIWIEVGYPTRLEPE